MESEPHFRSKAAKAVGRIGLSVGVAAVGCLVGLCIVESSGLVNPGQATPVGWIIFISFMVALNVPAVAFAMWASARYGIATALAVTAYLILSCWHDSSLMVQDLHSPSYVGIGLFFYFPFVRPIPLVVLFGVGFAVDRFRTA